MLGLGNNLKKQGLTTPGIITDSLVLKHKYDAGAVVPVSDGAAYFDGTDDYITMGDVTSFDGKDNLTISAWVKFLDTNAQAILTKGEYNNSSSSFSFDYEPSTSSGRLKFSVSNDRYDYLNNCSLSTNGSKWHHLAVTYSNTTDETFFYIDGVKNTPTAGSGTYASISNTSKNLLIGDEDGDTDFLKGYVCNIGTWESVLTQAQIKSIMNKNYAGLLDSEKTNLVSWWNLDSDYIVGDTTHRVTDSHGSNDGTLT